MAEEGGNGSAASGRMTSRRSFLAGAAGLTGVALAVGAWKPVFAEVPPRLAADPVHDKRVFTSAIAMKFGETSAGFLSSAVGGNATADVVAEKVGPDLFLKKHLANVKYEDITVTAGRGMGKEFYSWLASAINGQTVEKTGSIVGADFNLKAFTRTDFFNAVITEVGFPALDAASKDAAKMTIKFSPLRTRTVSNPGGTVGRPTNLKWTVSNFKFTINGVDTTTVNKVDAITIKSMFNFSEDERFPTEVDIPNMKISIADAHVQDLVKWHTDFVIKGNNSSENEKKGSLSFLASDLKTEVFRLDFSGLGIFALDPDPLALNADGIRRTTAQFYCQKMNFTFKV